MVMEVMEEVEDVAEGEVETFTITNFAIIVKGRVALKKIVITKVNLNVLIARGLVI